MTHKAVKGEAVNPMRCVWVSERGSQADAQGAFFLMLWTLSQHQPLHAAAFSLFFRATTHKDCCSVALCKRFFPLIERKKICNFKSICIISFLATDFLELNVRPIRTRISHRKSEWMFSLASLLRADSIFVNEQLHSDFFQSSLIYKRLGACTYHGGRPRASYFLNTIFWAVLIFQWCGDLILRNTHYFEAVVRHGTLSIVDILKLESLSKRLQYTVIAKKVLRLCNSKGRNQSCLDQVDTLTPHHKPVPLQWPPEHVAWAPKHPKEEIHMTSLSIGCRIQRMQKHPSSDKAWLVSQTYFSFQVQFQPIPFFS